MAKKPNKSGAGAPPPMPNAGNAGVGRPPTAGGGRPAGKPARPTPTPTPTPQPKPTGGAARGVGAAKPATKTQTSAKGGKVVTKTTTILPAATTTGAPKVRKVQAPPPTIPPAKGGASGGSWSPNWGWVIGAIALSLLLWYLFQGGGMEKITGAFNSMSPKSGIIGGNAPAGEVHNLRSGESVMATAPQTLVMTNGIVIIGGIIHGNVVNGDNYGNGGATSPSTSPGTSSVTVTPPPAKAAPAPAPAPSWPHDGSQPSVTVRTMSECDEADAGVTSDTKTFTLKANSNVAYRTPYGFRVEFYPSDTSRLDKAFNVGSTPAPIWKSTGEYAGSKEPTASVWYFNRGNTDVEIRIESTRTNPPRER